MTNLFNLKKFLILNSSFLIALCSCSVQTKIGKSANKILIKDSSLSQAHLGISIYDPATSKYLYNYQGDKYFVPASNTKLYSCYAAMKYLGDSLKGLLYYSDTSGGVIEISPTGDPTLLHPDFKNHPVLDFLKQVKNPVTLTEANWKENALGYGWAWDDYNGEYMVERSPMPVYGNVLKVSFDIIQPAYFNNVLSLPDTASGKKFSLTRDRNSNRFTVSKSNANFYKQEIPFVTNNLQTAVSVLKADHGIKFYEPAIIQPALYIKRLKAGELPPNLIVIHSQPTDSVLKPMMHRSDNFFAEQLLLMVSNEKLGYMKDADIIDTLLKTDLKDAPQKPKWVDGSGLSRYNLFTPQDFIYILDKMKTEFGLDRLKNILATGGEGTISSYYQNMAGSIFAKTGTLSNNCALSGFLIARSGRLLIFSVLANNYQGAATPVRRAVEKFLNNVRDTY